MSLPGNAIQKAFVMPERVILEKSIWADKNTGIKARKIVNQLCIFPPVFSKRLMPEESVNL